MKVIIKFEADIVGNATEEEIIEYICGVVLGCGSCSQDNPFISDDCDDEISFSNVEIE